MRINLELMTRGYFKGFTSVMDLGSQDLQIGLDEFTEIVQSAGLADFDRREFLALADFPGRRIGTRRFYQLLGFENYQCFDIAGDTGGIHPDDIATEAVNGMRWNATQFDLNCPLDNPDLEGAFDVVTDYSNNEHAFNTTEAFRTMHRLCRSGGLLIVSQQMHITNGYHKYNPIYFHAMAAANGYERVFAGLGVNNYLVSLDSGIEPLLDPNVRMPLVIVMRKVKDAPFVVPEAFSANASPAHELVTEFSCPRLPETRPRRYLPMKPKNNIALVGGRDALRVLMSRFVPFARNSTS